MCFVLLYCYIGKLERVGKKIGHKIIGVISIILYL